MWLYTQHGIASIVQDRKDPNYMWVRTRNEEDAEAIRALNPVLADTEIVHWKGRDYEWRFRASRAAVQTLMANIVLGLDYDNFKDRAAKTTPHNKSVLYGVYNATLNATDIYVKPESGNWWSEPTLFDGNPHYADYGTDPLGDFSQAEDSSVLDRFADWLEK